jgi:acyl-CoA synthetase (AMP-forming)/AMP-acid ligase II
MTECPMISQGSPTDTDDQLAHSEGAPVYRCEISTVRADGTDAAPGEEGEVRLAGPMLFKGYTDASLNEGAFDEKGRFRTGDLGVLREDGHITLTGRLKDVIIRKGENISAKEVEDVLYAHPKVGDVAVIGLPDRERGERVCAVVETAPGQQPITFDEMVTWCKEAGLMLQKVPEQLEVMDKLPRNATLKVLKYQLRDELKGKPAG